MRRKRDDLIDPAGQSDMNLLWEIQPQSMKKVGSARRWIGGLLLAVLLFFLTWMTVAGIDRYKVISNSMYPTLHTGDFVLSRHLESDRYIPAREDVVVFWDPEKPHNEMTDWDDQLTKRVIGLPGETIEVHYDRLTIGDYDYDVPLWKIRKSRYRIGDSIELGEGEVFLLGDNQSNSHDSLYFGPVRVDQVFGKVFFVYWPLNHFGKLGSVETLKAKEMEN